MFILMKFADRLSYFRGTVPLAVPEDELRPLFLDFPPSRTALTAAHLGRQALM